MPIGEISPSGRAYAGVSLLGEFARPFLSRLSDSFRDPCRKEPGSGSKSSSFPEITFIPFAVINNEVTAKSE